MFSFNVEINKHVLSSSQSTMKKLESMVLYLKIFDQFQLWDRIESIELKY